MVRPTWSQVLESLEKENVEARPVWKPMHVQPVYRSSPCYGGAVAEGLFQRGLCLPSGSDLSGEDLDRIVAIVRKAWGDDRTRAV